LGESYRDVYIEVEETTTGNVGLFFGFSSADDIFGGLDLSETNFNYRGIPRLFRDGPGALRGGGEYAHARANIGAKQRTYTVSWLTPYFRDTLWRVGFDVSESYSTLITSDYRMETLGFSLYASYPLNYLWSFGTKYRFRNSMTHVPKHAPALEREQSGNTGIISGIGSSLSFDSTDSAVKPHRGFRSSLEGELVGVWGTYNYLRFAYVNSYYSPLWKYGTMKYRWDVRFIEPLWKTNHPNDIPLTERFFIGGLTSVRGYKDFDLGPHYSKTGDPEGGISSAVLSLEYLQTLLPIADAFVFADAGSISMKRFNLPTFRLTTGVGLRLELMNRVPIILGLGFPINRDHHSELRKFFFSMGGQF
jgi:outer membrane protein insertion porin family